jgi:hypothetical protein
MKDKNGKVIKEGDNVHAGCYLCTAEMNQDRLKLRVPQVVSEMTGRLYYEIHEFESINLEVIEEKEA